MDTEKAHFRKLTNSSLASATMKKPRSKGRGFFSYIRLAANYRGVYPMGCLLEMLFDLLLEGSMNITARCYIKLLAFILPGKTVSDRTRRIIECVMGIFGLCLYLALIVGVIMVLQDGLITKTVGRYMILISLILFLLPVALGIAVWGIRRFKNRNSASRS